MANVIGIAGKRRSGKSEASKVLQGMGWQSYSFATPLKQTAKYLWGLTDEQVYGDEKDVVISKYGITPRRMLQVLGTEVTNQIWKDTWVDILPREIQDESLVVIDDIRFPKEVIALKHSRHHVIIVRCDRPDVNRMSIDDTHLSEVDLEDQYVDVIASNSGNLRQWQDWWKTFWNP